MTDAIGQAFSGLGNIGGQALNGIESGIGSVGNFVGGIPGDIGSLLGGANGGSGSPVSPATAMTSAAAGAGSPAATSVPAAPTTGVSAASAAAPFSTDLTAGGGNSNSILDQVLGGSGSGATSGGSADPLSSAGVGLGAGTPAANSWNTGPLASNVTGPSTAPNAAAAPSGISGFLKQYGPALGLGLGGLDLINSMQTPAAVKALKNQQAQEQAQVKMLQPAIAAEQQGQLPAAAQAAVTQALNKQIAQIRSQYAQMGLSGSSAEAQDIQAAQQQALSEQFQIGQGMASQGLQQLQSADSASVGLLNSILQSETAQGTSLGNLLAEFAGLTTPRATQSSVTAA